MRAAATSRPHHRARARHAAHARRRPPARPVSREALGGDGGAGNERTVDVQVNRLRRKIERDPANPLHLQTVRGAGYRLAIDDEAARMALPLIPARAARWRRALRAPSAGTMPKGLFARALLIVIVPMVILQSAIACFFMERHGRLVTFACPTAVTPGHRRADRHPPCFRYDPDNATLEQIAAERLDLEAEVLPTDRCRPRCRSRSSRCSTARCRRKSPGRSAGPSGSTRSGVPTSSKSAIEMDDAHLRVFARRSAGLCVQHRISSSSGWSAPRWC